MTEATTQLQCPCGAAISADAVRCDACGRAFERPAVLGGKWRVERRLGMGGMGAVYLAVDLSLGRRVAVKVLHPALADDKSFVARFQREARVMARLDHPGLVPIYAIEHAPEGLLLVMKFIEGQTLSAYLKKQGRLPLSEVSSLLKQLAEAVGALHRHGFVHRDLKPSNMIVQDDGRLVLLDFGLARRSAGSDRLTTPGTALGSGHYMAPEQARDEAIDHRTDLYALAVIAFECLSGKLPFAGETAVALFRRLNEEPPLLSSLMPDLPPQVSVAVARGMALNPTARFDDLASFITALGDASQAPSRGDVRTIIDEVKTRQAMNLDPDATTPRGGRVK